MFMKGNYLLTSIIIMASASSQAPLNITYTENNINYTSTEDNFEQPSKVYEGYLIISDAHSVEESTEKIIPDSESMEETIVTFFHNPVFNGLGIFLSGGIMLAIIIGCLLAVFFIFRKMSKTIIDTKHKVNVYQVKDPKQSVLAR